MKLSLDFRTLISLYNALGALDGFQKAVGDKTIFCPYKFSDETRRAIVKNRRALKPHHEEYVEQENALIKAIANEFSATDGAPRDYLDELNPAEATAFNARQRKLQREEKRDVELFPIAESALLVEGKNPIPGTILEALAPLTDTPAENVAAKEEE